MQRKRMFVPELHDIHPGSYDAIACILSFLPPAVRDTLAFLIVPCWRGQEPIDRESPILTLIHPLPGERVLHGYSHCRTGSIWNFLWYGTDHHGEFECLDTGEARMLITHGLTAFKEAGLPRPRLFCPPRWLQSKATVTALFELGFTGYMDRRGYRTRNGVRYPIPAVSFDTGHRKWKKHLHLFLTHLHINSLIATGRPFRLALHPGDTGDNHVIRFLARLFRRLEREEWRAATIGEVINL